MTNINCLKTGNTIRLSIGNKLMRKDCATAQEADELFRTIQKAKDNPTEENINRIRALINERTRVALMVGLDSFVADMDAGLVFLAGFNTPVPDILVEVIKEYHENDYPLDPIINFWKLLMANPDTRVRESLFRFIQAHDFVLTDAGYMVVYKAVDYKDENKRGKKSDKTLEFEEFVTNKYLFVRNEWKCSPRKYVVYKNANGEYEITKKVTANNWNEREMSIEILGNLADLFKAIIKEDEEKPENAKTVYTDRYSHTMTIMLGVPAKKERHLCDADPNKDCSNGLHCGATAYVNNFASSADAVLVCLVNPMNVVAVPDHDCTKMRVSEYFPYAVADYDYDTREISIVKQMYFEEDYKAYEAKELNEIVKKLQAKELPFKAAQNAEEESRPMSELLKIIEGRLVDLEEIVFNSHFKN